MCALSVLHTLHPHYNMHSTARHTCPTYLALHARILHSRYLSMCTLLSRLLTPLAEQSARHGLFFTG